MGSKSILKLDIEELESDEAALKWSALKNAARMSCYTSKCCLGPGSDDTKQRRSPEKPSPVKSEISVPKESGEKIAEVKNSPPKSQTIDYEIFDKFALMKLAEKQRRNNVRKELELKQKQFHQQKQAQRQLSIESSMKMKTANDLKYRAEQLIIQDAESIVSELIEENRKRQLNQREEHRQRMEHLKREQQHRHKRALCENIFKYQLKFGETYQIILNRFKQIDWSTYTGAKSLNNSLRLLITSFDGLVQKIKSDDVVDNDLKIAENLFLDIEQLQKQLDIEIADLSQPKMVAAPIVQEKQQKVEEVAPVAVQQVQHQQSEEQTGGQTVTDSAQVALDALSCFVSPDNFTFYNSIMTFYSSKVESVKPLQADDNMKKYRSNCQKAINIPVNTISAVSAQHLQDKYDKLYGLVSGAQINTVDGPLSAMDHPLGRDFCLLLLAKKFVSQGDSTVSSNPQAAFPIAAIIVAIWQKIPEFGQLFLAYAFKECPYLVPYFMPQFKGQSKEEYYKILGYRLPEGVLEKQDMYLKRQTGLIKLYTAVMVTRTRPSDGPIHPYGIEHGWRWLCNLLNLEPLPDICATLILSFLQMAGFEMWRIFRGQFSKILRILQLEYLPRLSKVDEGGPKARLEVFLLKVIKDNMIETPAGLLAPNFW